MRRLAWDSSVFTAALRRDAPPLDLRAIDAAFDALLAGRIEIVASQWIEMEVLPGTRSQTETYHLDLLAIPSFSSVPDSPRIRDLAQALAYGMLDAGLRPRALDMTHIAAAISVGASEFWTLDRKLVRYGAAGHLPGIRVVLPHAAEPLPEDAG